MIKALNISPDVFATLTKALLDHEAGGGRYQRSENPALEMLWLLTPLSQEDATRVVNSQYAIPTIIVWSWRYRAELVEEWRE